ncbi:uracil-Dna glycosylase D183gK302R mutant [Gaertneriomyces semiglobifer]|nr:uracil-Dna glycosylase D183gK302R mutant [Gaertneriomyces semiglobifer]
MAPDWYRAFEAEMHKPYFLDIKRFLLKDGQNNIIYPAETELYSFTRCPLSKVKVVILGQDPYHGPGQAHGLCFSVKRGVPPPPSLLNIYKELEQDLGKDGFQRPPHGFLEGWTTEGVLLLNAALTVRKSQANSHKDIGWAAFTDAIISHLNKSKSGLVFMLWGGFAKKKGASIDKKKHLVLTSAHPSPLSANKGGWFGCKHFSQANSYLKKNGLGEVNWNHLP